MKLIIKKKLAYRKKYSNKDHLSTLNLRECPKDEYNSFKISENAMYQKVKQGRIYNKMVMRKIKVESKCSN